MVFYKIRHIPTGLFFKPSKHGSKSNLSKNGKVYQRKPTLKYLGDVYHHPITVPRTPGWAYREYESRRVILTDWEVVEYEVNE